MAIEVIPAIERIIAEELRLRLLCCAHLDGWGTGGGIAKMLEEGAEADRESAARFYYTLAGQRGHSRGFGLREEAIRKAVAACPPIRLALLDDPVVGPALFRSVSVGVGRDAS